MRTYLAILVAFALSACGGGGTNVPRPVPPPPPPPPVSGVPAYTQSIQGLTLDAFWFESAKGLTTRSPETVVQQALESIYPLEGNKLNDLTEAWRRDTYEMHQITLDVLRTYDRSTMSAANQLHYDVYEWYLADQVNGLEFINYSFPATYSIFGVPRNTEMFFTDLHPVDTPENARAYVDRLLLVNQKFQQLEEWLFLQRGEGVIEPALTMQVTIDQVAEIAQLNSFEVSYYTSFRDKLPGVVGLNAGEREELRSRAQQAMSSSVLPAYQRLLTTLQNLLTEAPSNIGVGQFPRGDEYYNYVLQHRTSTNLTAAEIHQLGLDELTRIHAEMRVIFDQLGYPQNETLQELFARVASDGGIVAAADTLTTFENLVAFAESNLAQAFDVFPAAPVVVLPHPTGGFYISPSFDGSRPGAFYAGTDFDQDYAGMPSLTFHETVPGHHMQIAIAMEQNLPASRMIVRTTGFVEGWALYAERLAWELGWYNNDVFGDLGRLQYEALRAARLVMDTGIHSLGWTFDEAVQFNDDNVGWPTPASQGAAARYSVIPGQATAYMIGMLQILDERQRAMDALGPNFDLRAFHRTLLTNGAVPLSLLPGIVDSYIAAAQAAP